MEFIMPSMMDSAGVPRDSARRGRPSISERLREVREQAKLRPEFFAKLTNIELPRWREIEEGARPSTDEIERCARVLGLRFSDLVSPDPIALKRTPLTLLFRSAFEEAGVEIDERSAGELVQGLGEFLRTVRDIHEIETLLNVAPTSLPRPTLPRAVPGESPGNEGEQRAVALRQWLRLEDAPIPSLRALVERLGVTVVWVTEDDLDRNIDGACTLEPRPAILVNLIVPEHHPWRTRITLAHELGHLLFDEELQRHHALVSPHRGSNGAVRGLELIEQRARAFAACLLAPSGGVREAVKGLNPESEEAIAKVGGIFGVGRTVAVARLQRVFNLSNARRDEMLQRRATPYEGFFEEDTVREPLGFRGGPLAQVVQKAIARGVLPLGRARRLLGLPSSEALPFPDLPEHLRMATTTRAMEAVRTANRYLEKYRESGKLLYASHATEMNGTWRVEVFSGGAGAERSEDAGHLLLSSTGEVWRENLTPTTL